MFDIHAVHELALRARKYSVSAGAGRRREKVGTVTLISFAPSPRLRALPAPPAGIMRYRERGALPAG